MPPKSKGRTAPNTSATAKPVASADVLATAAAPAAAEAITPPPAEGATSVGEAPALPPLGDTATVTGGDAGDASHESTSAVGDAVASVTENAGELIGLGVDEIIGAAGAVLEDEYAFTHEIKAVPAKGFCRAGRRWPQESSFTHRDDWTDDQWAALTGEANLIVRPL